MRTELRIIKPLIDMDPSELRDFWMKHRYSHPTLAAYAISRAAMLQLKGEPGEYCYSEHCRIHFDSLSAEGKALVTQGKIS